MKEYIVIGSTPVTINCRVQADSPTKAIERAMELFGGIHSCLCDKGAGKRIGVDGEGETIAAYKPVKFDYCVEA